MRTHAFIWGHTPFPKPPPYAAVTKICVASAELARMREGIWRERGKAKNAKRITLRTHREGVR